MINFILWTLTVCFCAMLVAAFFMSFCSADVKEHAPMWMGTTYKITVREQI